MILTAHAVTGVALASLVPNKPLIGFTLGFISHFVLDSLPHSDYKLLSKVSDINNPLNSDMILDERFLVDIVKICLDGLMGLLIGYLIFGLYLKYSFFIILCGATGGMMPDALQFVYMKWKREPLVGLQKLHIWVHHDKNR